MTTTPQEGRREIIRLHKAHQIYKALDWIPSASVIPIHSFKGNAWLSHDHAHPVRSVIYSRYLVHKEKQKINNLQTYSWDQRSKNFSIATKRHELYIYCAWIFTMLTQWMQLLVRGPSVQFSTPVFHQLLQEYTAACQNDTPWLKLSYLWFLSSMKRVINAVTQLVLHISDFLSCVLQQPWIFCQKSDNMKGLKEKVKKNQPCICVCWKTNGTYRNGHQNPLTTHQNWLE